MKLPEFKAAMFDMDGTLTRTMRYWRLTSLEFLFSMGIFPTDEQMSCLLTSSSRKYCQDILAEHGIEMSREEILKKLEFFMKRHYESDAFAKPRTAEFLETLKARGIPMCVGTAAPRELAIIALTRFGLIDYFDFVVDCYQYGINKTSPDFFRMMADKMGVEPKDMCVFEDAVYSIRTAKELGCPVVGIEDPTQRNDREEIIVLSDIYIKEYEELLQ